jgi:hypothetical protein
VPISCHRRQGQRTGEGPRFPMKRLPSGERALLIRFRRTGSAGLMAPGNRRVRFGPACTLDIDAAPFPWPGIQLSLPACQPQWPSSPSDMTTVRWKWTTPNPRQPTESGILSHRKIRTAYSVCSEHAEPIGSLSRSSLMECRGFGGMIGSCGMYASEESHSTFNWMRNLPCDTQ